MKVLITDLESGAETELHYYAPRCDPAFDEDDPLDADIVRSFREETIKNIIGKIYIHFFHGFFTVGSQIEHNETFILSPHADMVREESEEIHREGTYNTPNSLSLLDSLDSLDRIQLNAIVLGIVPNTTNEE